MKTMMIRYKTSEIQASENETLIHAVFDELRSRAPAGVRYASYRLADGVTFVHLVSATDSDDKVISSLQAFQAFRKGLAERCVEAPVFTEWLAVDSYGLPALGGL